MNIHLYQMWLNKWKMGRKGMAPTWERPSDCCGVLIEEKNSPSISQAVNNPFSPIFHLFNLSLYRSQLELIISVNLMWITQPYLTYFAEFADFSLIVFKLWSYNLMLVVKPIFIMQLRLSILFCHYVLWRQWWWWENRCIE